MRPLVLLAFLALAGDDSELHDFLHFEEVIGACIRSPAFLPASFQRLVV